MLLLLLSLSLLLQTVLGMPIDPVLTLVFILPELQSYDLTSLARTGRAIVAMASGALAAAFVAYCEWKLRRLRRAGGATLQDRRRDPSAASHTRSRGFEPGMLTV